MVIIIHGVIHRYGPFRSYLYGMRNQIVEVAPDRSKFTREALGDGNPDLNLFIAVIEVPQYDRIRTKR